VHCPSDYQLTQHLRGQKHANVVKYGKEKKSSSSYDSGGGGAGVCYKFQKNGFCPYGNSCTYRHIKKNKPTSITTPSKTCQVAATNRSGPAPLGVCYIWWNRGNCDKGMSCTYKHSITTASSLSSSTAKITSQDDDDDDTDDFCKVINDGILVSPPSQIKRPRDNGKNNIVVSTEIILCKTNNPDKGNEEKKEQPTTVKKLASIFCKPPASAKPKTKEESKYPEIYRNLFYRKQDINLLIKDGLVVWEFAYNVKVMEAIKVYIKGRAWNPNIGGRKGCWTAPIESLPDCIDLYEHMGRTASDGLRNRAMQIKRSYGDSSASDAIKLSIDIYLNNTSSVGSIDVTFLYDTAIVSAFKMLPPTQRSYDPASKVWTVDLFALPSLIDILIPLGYNATKRLRTISNLTKLVDDLVYDDQDADATINNSLAATFEEINDKHDEVIDLSEDSDDDGSSNNNNNNNNNNMLSKLAAGNVDKCNKLEKILKSLVRLVGQNNDSNSPTIDVSSCGTFKRPKIEETTTGTSYNRRASRYDDDFDYDDDDGYDDYMHGYEDDIMNELDTYMQNYRSRDHHRGGSSVGKTSQHLPSDCDCGNPHKMSAGKHTCRYFGTFQCVGCDKRWTSAYCWKGEKQACRSCNEESFPIQKDKLDGRPPVMESASGRGHDSARCGRCRSLGYNCSY
jgi:hypothetical protein